MQSPSSPAFPSPPTIVALASGTGRAGVAVIRASGPGVPAALPALVGTTPAPRQATLRTLRHPVSGTPLDQALVLVFPAPASFTGEDVAEFHVHGGRAVIAATLDALTTLPGWRLAEPGEFTRRAVGHGRMDLTAAEGLADLVAADTAGQRRAALAQAGGALERAAGGWRERLIRALALMEAEIDFPEEADVPPLAGPVGALIAGLIAEIGVALASRVGERLREGAMVVIAGPPNAGKSTLLNALARREAAIVSAIPGTTRDAIEVMLDVGGWPVTLVDTAGLRDSDDPVERIGIERARIRAAAADHVLWLSPADDPLPCPPNLAGATILLTKADLVGGLSVVQRAPTPRSSRGTAPASPSEARPPDALPISAATGHGLPALLDRLAAVTEVILDTGEPMLVTRARHRQELGAVLDALHRAAVPGLAPELVAEDLRLALRALGRLSGTVDIDEVYDVVFREFCIGK